MFKKNLLYFSYIRYILVLIIIGILIYISNNKNIISI